MNKPTTVQAWLLACRPKTLTGALAPIIIAVAAAWKDTNGNILWIPAILCALFAMFMQIDANLINDYYDGIRGEDKEGRLGPERACSMGWISFKSMKIGITIVSLLACIVGLPLITYGGWEMIIVGFSCLIFCILYTTLLSRLALGDLLVLLFFGIIPICITYFILTGTITTKVILYSIAMGLVTDQLLLVNNCRDIEQDKEHGKNTLVVIVGEKKAKNLYLLVGIVAILIVALADFSLISIPLFAPFAVYFAYNYKRLKDNKEKRELNKLLGQTALGILVFALALSFGIIIN